MAGRELTLDELAGLTGGRTVGDGSTVIKDAAPIDDAGPGDVAFIDGAKNLKHLETTGASVVIVKEGEAGDTELAGRNALVVANPQLAFARVLAVLRPGYRPEAGAHPRAEVDKDARVGADVSIGAFAVVERGAEIGDRAILMPGVYVGPGVRVGEDSVLHAGVAVREGCRIGKRVIIHCNSVIGSDGFGYTNDDEGRLVKVPQTGGVVLEDDVEIGACVTVDRATIGDTVIGCGTKIDNLVQIAHNVRVGSHTVMAAQVGVAGSTTVGSHVQLGGQVGLAGHIRLGDRAAAGAKAGVHGNVPDGHVVSGYPAFDHRAWLKSSMVVPRLPELRRKIQELEKRVAELEDERGS